MNYIDPYKLLGLQVSGPHDATDEMVASALASLAAKISQSPTDDIEVDGKKIAKTDAQQLSMAMGDASARSYFWEMRSIPGLLDFLESNQAAKIQAIQFPRQNAPSGLIPFASNWAAIKVDALLGKALETKRWGEAMALLRNLHLLDSAAESKAIVQAKAYFEGLQQQLEKILADSQSRPVVVDSRKYFQTTMLGVLNTMPASCQAFRDQYAITLGNWASTLVKWQAESETAYLIAVAATKIATSEPVAAKMRNLQQKLKDETGITAKDDEAMSGAKLAGGVGAGVFAVLIIIRILLMIMRHNS